MAAKSHTADYFEGHARDYDPKRLRTAAAWVGELSAENDALFDVGCGTGQVVAAMRRVGVTRLAGCDLAGAALQAAGERVEFTAYQGSILDEGFVDRLAGRFRFVTMSAVLHHIVGGTRRSSRSSARRALHHALRLLEPGGYLVVIEPTYEPRWAMTALFWTKRLLSPWGRRIEVGAWNNLGAPVVSYYGREELALLVAESGGTTLRREDLAMRLRRLPGMLGVRGRWTTTLLAQAVVAPGTPRPEDPRR